MLVIEGGLCEWLIISRGVEFVIQSSNQDLFAMRCSTIVLVNILTPLTST